MSSDLVYRMRTCAAAIAASQESGDPWDTTRIATDAADLLLEASNEIAQEDFLGEPMEIIPPLPEKPVEGPSVGRRDRHAADRDEPGAASAQTMP